MIIVPAVMQKDLGEVQRQISLVEPFAEIVQLDVCDGLYIPTETMHDPDQLHYVQTNIDLEIHLMVKNPQAVLYRWLIDERVKRVYIHIDTTDNTDDLIKEMRNASKDVGITLGLEHTPAMIAKYLDAGQVDNVLLHAVKPGQQGQKHDPSILAKLVELKAKWPHVKVGVDGGLNDENVKPLAAAGADIFIFGSFIMKAADPNEAYRSIRRALRDAR